jgi:hypothetical protein
MGIHLPAAVALDADIRIRVARLAGLQVPPRFSRMIRIPVVDLRGTGLPMGFDVHAAFIPYLRVAVLTETRLVAAIAVPGVVRRLDRMDGNKIGAVRLGHELPSARRTPLQIGFDSPAFVAVDTEGLLMTIRAIIPCLLGQQPVLRDKKVAVIAHHAGAAVAVLTIIKLGIFVFSVVGPGEGDTDEHEKKGRGQQDYFNHLIIYHDLPSQVHFLAVDKE